MTEVKVTYLPLRCGFGGGICECPSEECRDFNELVDEEDPSSITCSYSHFDTSPCFYSKKVSSFQYDGIDAYGDFCFTVGKKVFASWNCSIESLEVDGKYIVGGTKDESVQD